jgi:hypothetical protein
LAVVTCNGSFPGGILQVHEICDCARLTSMRRPSVIAVLLAGLILSSTLQAQMRSAPRSMGGHSMGFRSSAPVPSGGFRSFAPSRPMPGPMARGAFRPGISRPGTARAGFFRPGPQTSRFPGRNRPFGGWYSPGHRFNYFQPWFQPWLWSNWGYPGFYFGPGYPWSSLSYPGFPEDYQQAQEEQPAGPDYGAAPAYNDTLANQVQELSQELEALRHEQSRPPAPAEAQPAAQEKATPTVFAYRDGHQFEARNYAIQGQTLWVFGDQITRKISLADLDLGATKQLNDARGVEFSLPQSR